MENQGQTSLEWVSLPARNNPKGLFLAAGTILLAGLAVGLLARTWGADPEASLWWGVFSVALLFISLRGFFLPTRYRLDSEGVTVKEPLFTRNKPWSDLKSLHVDRHGVLVSPFSFSTRLENFRGLYLRFAGNRDDVLAFCERHVRQVSDLAGSEDQKKSQATSGP